MRSVASFLNALDDDAERRRVAAAEAVFRNSELGARQRGLYDAADAIRMIGDMVASGGKHWPMSRSFVKEES